MAVCVWDELLPVVQHRIIQLLLLIATCQVVDYLNMPRCRFEDELREYFTKELVNSVVFGGGIHSSGKKKSLSNQSSNIRKEIEIDDIKVEILTREEEESTKYLGQMITFQQQETTEIRSRIRAA